MRLSNLSSTKINSSLIICSKKSSADTFTASTLLILLRWTLKVSCPRVGSGSSLEIEVNKVEKLAKSPLFCPLEEPFEPNKSSELPEDIAPFKVILICQTPHNSTH